MKLSLEHANELCRIIDDTDVFEFNEYFLISTGKPKNIENGYVTQGKNQPGFYVGYRNHILMKNLPFGNNDVRFEIEYFPESSKLEICFDERTSEDLEDYFDIISVVVPYSLYESEEMYFQSLTVTDHPLSWKHIQKVKNFFDSCIQYAEKQKEIYLNNLKRK